MGWWSVLERSESMLRKVFDILWLIKKMMGSSHTLGDSFHLRG